MQKSFPSTWDEEPISPPGSLFGFQYWGFSLFVPPPPSIICNFHLRARSHAIECAIEPPRTSKAAAAAAASATEEEVAYQPGGVTHFHTPPRVYGGGGL